MLKVTVPNLATLLIVQKKNKISDIGNRYAQSAAQVYKEIGKLKEPEDEQYEYGRTVANKLRCTTPYQAALARRNIENMLFNVQYGSPTPASATPQRPRTHDKPTTPFQNVTTIIHTTKWKQHHSQCRVY